MTNDVMAETKTILDSLGITGKWSAPLLHCRSVA